MRASRSSRPAFRSYALKHSLPCQMDMDADLTEVAGTLPKVRLLTTPEELAWTCNTKITVIHLFSAVVERYCTGTMNMKFGYHMHSAARCEGKPSPVFVLFELILFVLQVGQRRRGKDEVYARVDIRRTRSFCSNAQWPSVFFCCFFLFLRPWMVYPRCFFPISKKKVRIPSSGSAYQRNDFRDLCASGDDAVPGGPIVPETRPVSRNRPPRTLGVSAQKAQM